MDPETKEWWEGTKPILDGGSDGQTYKQIFARKLGNEWEYVVVTFSNDGIAEEWTTLFHGRAEEYNR